MQIVVCVASSCNRHSIHHRLSHVLTRPSPKVLDNVSQLLVPASVMLREGVQQVYTPLLVWDSETDCSDGHTETKSVEEMFHYHTHAQILTLVPLRIASQLCKHIKYTQKSNPSTCSLSYPAVGTCLDKSLLVHKSQNGLLCLCLPRNFH